MSEGLTSDLAGSTIFALGIWQTEQPKTMPPFAEDFPCMASPAVKTVHWQEPLPDALALAKARIMRVRATEN